MLVVFKYTSNQRAIKRVRDDISANLLTLKLFKDNTSAVLKAQGRLLLGAGRLLVLALVPMAVMIVPVTLLLGQLSLWYEKRPLPVGEEAIVVMRLGGGTDDPFPAASLRPTDGVEATVGPVRVRTDGRREMWWNVRGPGSRKSSPGVCGGRTAGGKGTGGRRRRHARQHDAARLELVGRPDAPVRDAVRSMTPWSSRSRSSIPSATRGLAPANRGRRAGTAGP